MEDHIEDPCISGFRQVEFPGTPLMPSRRIVMPVFPRCHNAYESSPVLLGLSGLYARCIFSTPPYINEEYNEVEESPYELLQSSEDMHSCAATQPGMLNEVIADPDATSCIQEGNLMTETTYSVEAEPSSTVGLHEEFNSRTGISDTDNEARDIHRQVEVFADHAEQVRGELHIDEYGIFPRDDLLISAQVAYERNYHEIRNPAAIGGRYLGLTPAQESADEAENEYQPPAYVLHNASVGQCTISESTPILSRYPVSSSSDLQTNLFAQHSIDEMPIPAWGYRNVLPEQQSSRFGRGSTINNSDPTRSLGQSRNRESLIVQSPSPKVVPREATYGFNQYPELGTSSNLCYYTSPHRFVSFASPRNRDAVESFYPLENCSFRMRPVILPSHLYRAPPAFSHTDGSLVKLSEGRYGYRYHSVFYPDAIYPHQSTAMIRYNSMQNDDMISISGGCEESGSHTGISRTTTNFNYEQSSCGEYYYREGTSIEESTAVPPTTSDSFPYSAMSIRSGSSRNSENIRIHPYYSSANSPIFHHEIGSTLSGLPVISIPGEAQGLSSEPELFSTSSSDVPERYTHNSTQCSHFYNSYHDSRVVDGFANAVQSAPCSEADDLEAAAEPTASTIVENDEPKVLCAHEAYLKRLEKLNVASKRAVECRHIELN